MASPPLVQASSSGVGLPITKDQIDSRAGTIAQTAQKLFQDITTMQTFLERSSVDDLVALGYTTDDVTLLKSAVGDLAELANVWKGGQPLPQAKDFRTFVSRIWGVGAF